MELEILRLRLLIRDQSVYHMMPLWWLHNVPFGFSYEREMVGMISVTKQMSYIRMVPNGSGIRRQM